MVSRVEEANKTRQQQEGVNTQVHNKVQGMLNMQSNKGRGHKFKRSFSDLQEDGASSAILLLACIACAPTSPHQPTISAAR
nr:Nuclear speckle splicing regulatory protein like [Ipomoea batatas]